MRNLYRRLDRHLRRRLELIELSDGPECLFRVRPTEAQWDLRVPGGVVPAGRPILELHFWNEHMPPRPTGEADLEWGTRAARKVVGTFRLIGRELPRRPELAEAEAVGGVTAMIFPDSGQGAEKLLRRLGFEVTPHRPASRFVEFWQNFHVWILLWTYNPASLGRRRHPWALRRSEVWMTREQFLDRYGRGDSPGAVNEAGGAA